MLFIAFNDNVIEEDVPKEDQRTIITKSNLEKYEDKSFRIKIPRNDMVNPSFNPLNYGGVPIMDIPVISSVNSEIPSLFEHVSCKLLSMILN